jgi:hypothetical protein
MDSTGSVTAEYVKPCLRVGYSERVGGWAGSLWHDLATGRVWPGRQERGAARQSGREQGAQPSAIQDASRASRGGIMLASRAINASRGWDNMTFRSLQLIFPVLVGLHNAEEAIRLPRWTRRSGPWFGGVQPGVFRFAVVVFTALAAGVTVLSMVSGPMSFWGDVLFGSMAGLWLNSLVPHVAVSIAKRTLMPGVITAVVLNLPILPFLARLALEEGYVSKSGALVSSIVVPLVLVAMIPLMFRLGKAAVPLIRKRRG